MNTSCSQLHRSGGQPAAAESHCPLTSCCSRSSASRCHEDVHCWYEQYKIITPRAFMHKIRYAVMNSHRFFFLFAKVYHWSSNNTYRCQNYAGLRASPKSFFDAVPKASLMAKNLEILLTLVGGTTVAGSGALGGRSALELPVRHRCLTSKQIKWFRSWWFAHLFFALWRCPHKQIVALVALCDFLGGYNLTLARHRGHFGSGLTAALVAGGNHQGAESKQTVLTFEHRAATAKQVRARAFHRATRTYAGRFLYEVHNFRGDGRKQDMINNHK